MGRAMGSPAWLAVLGGLLANLQAPAFACPGPTATVLERFTSAECTECWQAANTPDPQAGWLFDWISPTAPEAPMAAAATREARDRAERAGGPAPAAQQSLMVRDALRGSQGLRLSIQTGPAWSGYIGAQLRASGPLPAGATVWLALVERIPAGSEGSALRRELVRTVAGPLPLAAGRPGRPIEHLVALRWPEFARPERLEARAWIEARDGRWLAIATERCPAR